MKTCEFDLYDRTSYTFKALEKMTDEIKMLKKEIDRISEVHTMLTYFIRNGKIDDTDAIDCAMSWLKHSPDSPYEIIDRVMN